MSFLSISIDFDWLSMSNGLLLLCPVRYAYVNTISFFTTAINHGGAWWWTTRSRLHEDFTKYINMYALTMEKAYRCIIIMQLKNHKLCLPALWWQPLKQTKIVDFLTWSYVINSPLSRINYSLVYYETNFIVACIFV